MTGPNELPEIQYFVKLRRLREKNNVTSEPDAFSGLRPDIYTPNYGFYVPNLVCWEHGVPRVTWRPGYSKFTAKRSEDFGHAFCNDCRKLDPVSFKKCPACGGAFYDMFRHQYQAKPFHHCWTCLESGSNSMPHDFYMQFDSLAPQEHLIPPVVTKESKADADKAFWDNIADILGG